jgi:hypothetical protein
MKTAALAVVALVLVLTVGSASAGPTGATRTITLFKDIESISAAGGRLAIEAAFPYPDQACYSGFMWTPSTGTLADLHDPCKVQTQYVGLALAGDIAIWWDYDAGNHVYCSDVYKAPAANPRVAHAFGICDGTMGDEYFEFAGDRTLVAVTNYTVCEADCTGANGQLLPDGNYGVEVRRLENDRLTTILKPVDFRRFLDAGNWRVAVIEPKNVLSVCDTRGTRMWREPGVAGVEGGWIVGDSVVVQQRRSVRAYSRAGAGPARTLPKGAHVDDVAGGLVLYRVGSSLHLLRLLDGRDRRVVQARGLIEGQITPAGVYYAVGFLAEAGAGGPKVAHHGRVTFVPLSVALRSLA